MNDLSACREEIDRIDDELTRLIVHRLAISEQVAEAKRATGRPVNDPQREREILMRLSGRVPEDCRDGVCQLFTMLFEISKAKQRERLGRCGALLDEE